MLEPAAIRRKAIVVSDPYRARLYAGADYPQYANEEIVTMAMIETKEALENLDDILSVPGLDAIFVGPSDLGQSLTGDARLDTDEPQLLAALDKILEAAKKHGVVAGIFTASPEYASRMVEKGFRFVTVSSDIRLMAQEAERVISAVKTEGQANKP